MDFYGAGAMIDRTMIAANSEMRQALARLAVASMASTIPFPITQHSTNHQTHTSVHLWGHLLVCERYHMEICNEKTRSVKDYGSHGGSAKIK